VINYWKYKTYNSPEGIYELEYPKSWILHREENILNIFPKDQIGAVTISAFLFKSQTNKDILQLLNKQFGLEKREIKVDLKKIDNTTIFEFEYLNEEDKRYWIVVGKKGSKNFALGTINSTEKDMLNRRKKYYRILDTLIVK
jgi:hypothetical protein